VRLLEAIHPLEARERERRETVPLEERKIVVGAGLHVLQRVHDGEEVEHLSELVDVDLRDGPGLLLSGVESGSQHFDVVGKLDGPGKAL